MPKEKYVYTKLNEIEGSNLKEFNIYGIIVDVFHKVSYDRQGNYQDEFRMKVNDGTTGDEDINVTAFASVGKIDLSILEPGKIIRIHRLTKNFFKSGGFYLCSRIGTISSLLLFDLPTPGARFKFNPCYRSNVNYSQSDKDEEIITSLIPKANAILAERQHQPTTSVTPPTQSAAPVVRQSPRKTPQKPSSQIPKTQPPSALKTPTRPQLSRPPQTRTPRRSARLRGQSPDPTIPPIDEEEEGENEESNAEDVEEDEPISCSTPNVPSQQQSQVSPVSSWNISSFRRPNITTTSSPPASARDLFTEISHLICGNSNYYNVLCQVVSCYRNNKGNIFLRVWDGTRNPRKTSSYFFGKDDLIYGDLKKEKQTAEDKKLYEVTCYNEHGRDAANSFKPGDYIALINVHFYIPKSCAFPSLVMHDGDGTIRNDNGQIVGAGRKVIKVTEEHRTAFSHIDALIKTHEPNLPVLEEAETDNDDAIQLPERQPVVSEESWNDFLGISPRSSSSIEIIDHVPAPAAAARVQQQQQPAAAAVRIQQEQQQQPITTGVFARRPQPIPFDTSQIISQQQQEPPEPKRPRFTQSPQKSQNSYVGTESLLDRLKAQSQSDDSQSQHDELRRLEAITDTQLENMWAEVENPDIQHSPPTP